MNQLYNDILMGIVYNGGHCFPVNTKTEFAQISSAVIRKYKRIFQFQLNFTWSTY